MRALKPDFLDKHHHLKLSVKQGLYFFSSLSLTTLIVWSLLNKNYLITLIAFLAIHLLGNIHKKSWLIAGYPEPIIFVLYQTIKNPGGNQGFRSLIILYLINKVRVKNGLPILNADNFFIANHNVKRPPLSLSCSYMLELEINTQGIKLHEYSNDPREAYFCTDYPSFNAFFAAFTSQQIIDHHRSYLFSYPEKVLANMDTYKQPLVEGAINPLYTIDLRLSTQYREFYQHSVKHFMHTPLYLIGQLYFNSR